MSVTVVEVTAADCHDLRRRVLRAGTPSNVVTFPEDERPDTFHLAAIDDDGAIAGVATFIPQPTPRDDAPSPQAELSLLPLPPRPEEVRAQLRGMAVEPALQGHGIGQALLAAGIDRLAALGVGVLWANARDSALGFYERCGFRVVGEGFVTADTRLPHHEVVRALR